VELNLIQVWALIEQFVSFAMHVPAYDTAVTSGRIVKSYYSESFV